MPSKTTAKAKAKTKTSTARPPTRALAAPGKKKGRWGGPRPGSGRKPGANPKVRHRARVVHEPRYPLHLSLPRAPGLPSFRSGQLLKVVREAVLDTGDARLDGFRVVAFVIGASEIDFLAEADDLSSLSRGLRSLSVRLAMRVNGALERTGRVFSDRFRARPLTTPQALKDATARFFARNRETVQAARTSLLKKLG